MTSIYFGEEHESFRRAVRQFLEGEVAPRAREWEEARRIPRDVFRRMGDLGFLGILAPGELGGADGSIYHAIALLEELPRSRMGGFVAAVSVQQFIATGAIALHGSEEQKRRWIAPSVAGTKVGAIAISEPDTGSDVAAIRTTARRDGDSWVIDGAKTWITNGVEGDFVVVACRTAADAGAGGISLVVVEADTPGFSRSRLRKMGWHCSDTAELTFENVRVPIGNLVGAENEGFFLILETFVLERLVTAATSVGSARLALEETRKYVLSREAFGRPIGKFQAIRHRLADLHAELEAAAQLVYHAAWLHEQGGNPVAEACMAKLLATELSKRTADECLQFFGGYGTVEEYPMERFFRDARFGTIVAGTSEIMREVIAKSVVDGVVFPGRKERAAAEPADGGGGADAEPPAGEAAAADAEALPDAFAGDLVPDLFVADATESLEAVFSEFPAPPGAGPEPPPPVASFEHGLEASFEPGPEAAPGPAAHAAEATVPAFVPPAPAPPPADVEVTEPAFFPEAVPTPAPSRSVPEVGSTSLAMKLPVPRSIEELFETLPLRFRADRAQGWNARLHFRFRDAARSDWTGVVEDGFCRTLEGHEGTPDCVVTTT
ncbi:MAG: acyl-CoA dehydrogenase family protein, partial [Thermoanaerobaculia bacterium]|nr:acyl-CoA dehydrogenase family protein [Thermoanaerobaculia bacterium]